MSGIVERPSVRRVLTSRLCTLVNPSADDQDLPAQDIGFLRDGAGMWESGRPNF